LSRKTDAHVKPRLAVILDDHQPNLSDLMNGKIAKFSIDKLVRYADRLGIETRVQTVDRKEPAGA
jgi:predicted XRE-type DNA-binding protein